MAGKELTSDEGSSPKNSTSGRWDRSKLVWNGNLSACKERRREEEGCEERWRVGKLGPLRGFYGGPTGLVGGDLPPLQPRKRIVCGLTKRGCRCSILLSLPPSDIAFRAKRIDDLYDAYSVSLMGRLLCLWERRFSRSGLLHRC